MPTISITSNDGELNSASAVLAGYGKTRFIHKTPLEFTEWR